MSSVENTLLLRKQLAQACLAPKGSIGCRQHARVPRVATVKVAVEHVEHPTCDRRARRLAIWGEVLNAVQEILNTRAALPWRLLDDVPSAHRREVVSRGATSVRSYHGGYEGTQEGLIRRKTR